MSWRHGTARGHRGPDSSSPCGPSERLQKAAPLGAEQGTHLGQHRHHEQAALEISSPLTRAGEVKCAPEDTQRRSDGTEQQAARPK